MKKMPTNEHGYYEIRLESIGGLGANLCGKLLGELGALKLSLNASGFSSYGSEKRGSPVKAYIRFCAPEKPIRINSPVKEPQLLCIFHEGLMGRQPVLAGISENTKIILNTALSPEKAAEKWNFSPATLYCVDALGLAAKSHARINMILLGAIAKASGFIPRIRVEELCRETIGQKYPDLIQVNLQGIRQGWKALSAPYPAPDSATPEAENHFTWGYDNAPLGGINPRPGSCVSNDLSPAREGYIPLFLPEKCIHCGLCDSTCPDMVFQFKPGYHNGKKCMLNSGLDYYHCKGCLRCVSVCPTGALVSALEKDYPQKPYFLPNKDLLPDSLSYEKTGANSYVTSDSYLTEKRVDKGVL